MTIQYYLRTSEELAQCFDTFAVSGCRLRLMGTAVSVECSPSDEARARALVRQYTEALRAQGLVIVQVLTPEEFASLPPEPSLPPNMRRSTRDLARTRERISQARRVIVGAVHPRLSQCYDYFEQARHEPPSALFSLYKLVETIEAEYGGERRASDALDSKALIKTLKSQANRSEHDQRHAPADPVARQPLSESTIAVLLDSAQQLITKFESAVGLDIDES